MNNIQKLENSQNGENTQLSANNFDLPEDFMIALLLSKHEARIKKTEMLATDGYQIASEAKKICESFETEVSNLNKKFNKYAEKEYFIGDENGYATLEAIGAMSIPQMNRQQLPNLLRKLGILQVRGIRLMAKYDKAAIEPLMKQVPYSDRSGSRRKRTIFHVGKLRYHMMKRLETLGLSAEFNSLKTNADVADFLIYLDDTIPNR